ncbi:MAG: OmpA family protein [Myxococcota bacterium]|jgi:outer membrane protein OmpA-like peptidoglycan-associated protein|nr:OmpA family protein [Myxococcota bacterium]
MRVPRCGRALLLVSSLGLLLPARAAQGDEGMNLLRFEPATSARDLLQTGSGRILEHLQVGGSLTFDYANAPLRVVNAADRSEHLRLVDRRLVATAAIGFGLLDRLGLAVALPMVITQSSGDLSYIGRPGDTITPAGTGNLRLIPKLSLLDESPRGFGATLLFSASIPTGDAADFLADAGPTWWPELAADYRFAPHGTVAINGGYVFRELGEFMNADVGDQITGSLGLEVPLVEQLSLVGNVFGALTVEGDHPFTQGEYPLEWLAGLRYYGPARLVVTLGGGTGLTSGFGNPRQRFFVQVGIDTPPPSLDPDLDEIVGEDDQCPDEPEDRDGFEDEDGCPDPDHDRDGVDDEVDQCLEEPEDRDGFEDEDGCPDPDNDGDGVPDTRDVCLSQAEDRDDFEDEDGCPDLDNDGDGVPDATDRCPNEAEDQDGYADEDGCPDPVHDRDHDGIPDEADRCPDEPETINGIKDDDGCPDKGVRKVMVTADEIRILDKIFFDTGKATIKKVSFSLLDQVAQTLVANPRILLIEIAGHTDDVGDDADNQALSQERAEAVLDYLLSRKVPLQRLRAKGYGETAPLVDVAAWTADKRTAKRHRRQLATARGQNRRVEFRILEQVQQLEKRVAE